MIPIVIFDQVYSFDRASLINGIPQPQGVSEEKVKKSAFELLDRVIQLADNAGATDEHRALNYLVVRYPAMYELAYNSFEENNSLSGVEVRISRLAGTRKIVDPISHTPIAKQISQRNFLCAWMFPKKNFPSWSPSLAVISTANAYTNKETKNEYYRRCLDLLRNTLF